jgi:uncharacterized protein (TIGR02391 family)
MAPASLEPYKAYIKKAKNLYSAAKPLARRSTKSSDRHFLYSSMVTDPELVRVSKKLFVNGHYAQAVEEAYKLLDNLIKKLSRVHDLSGAKLMKRVFSVQRPLLQVNDLKNQSQKDQQLGYMEIFSGCMTGIRNPRAHEHHYMDEPEVALEMLAWANHLISVARKSQITENQNTEDNV